MTAVLRRWAAALVMLGVSAGASSAAGPPNGTWQVVLAAGDRSEPVFDNATRALAEFFQQRGVPPDNIHRFTANPQQLGATVGRSLKRVLLGHIAGLPVQPGDRCLVFMTSHGEHGAGLYLAAAQEMLRPEELARALDAACGRVPTVVIVSACYSGDFAAGKMARPNRIVMTAARADRPSFGCQADRTYTFFDECLLAALPASPTWRAVFDQAATCVRGLEMQLGATPSEPQAYFGAAVRNLPTGFPVPRTGDAVATPPVNPAGAYPRSAGLAR